MIQKIESKRLTLPDIWLVEDENDWNSLPVGIPRILAKKEELDFIVLYLEYQFLLKSAIKTGLPLKWEAILEKIFGKANIRKYQLSSGGTFTGDGSGYEKPITIEAFTEDQYLVNFDKLTELKILPHWLDEIFEHNIRCNIIDEVMFDPTALNKQLGLNVGAGVVKTHPKNLIIFDCSGSMPDGVVKTLAGLCKLMGKRFYADILITGGKSFLIFYEDVLETDFDKMVEKCGRNNEGEMYRAIVKEHRKYQTVISFGDNDNPGTQSSTDKCNFTVDTLYSLHTEESSNNLTGYCRWLKPKTTIKVKDWLVTINK